jgi:hypothetical protein
MARAAYLEPLAGMLEMSLVLIVGIDRSSAVRHASDAALIGHRPH